MNTTLLKELIDLGDTFEQAYPNPGDQTKANFLAWATGEGLAKSVYHVELPQRYTDDVPALPTFIAQYLTKAYRYFRLYVKKAFETAPLLTFEDYISLVYLAERGGDDQERSDRIDR